VYVLYLSNITLFDGSGIYIVLLHKVQLHVSALDNDHLQVVHEILSKQLCGAIMGCIRWYSTGGEVGTRSRRCLEVGR